MACRAIGLLATKLRAVQVKDPKLQTPNSAVVRVNVTSNDALSPGARRSWSGVTVAVNPSGASMSACHVSVLLATFVIVRVMVAKPVTSATPIDARFRFSADVA